MKKDQLFVEKRPQGDFAVRKGGSERASALEPTQAKAIEWASGLERSIPRAIPLSSAYVIPRSETRTNGASHNRATGRDAHCLGSYLALKSSAARLLYGH
jgi:hypothetical protein